MKKFVTYLTLLIMFVISGCGNADKAREMEKVNSTSVENLKESDALSETCQKDLKAFSNYLEDAKAYIQKQKEGLKTTKAEKDKWGKRSRDILKEMGASSASFTDPKCALAFSKLQGEFVKVVSDIAKSPI